MTQDEKRAVTAVQNAAAAETPIYGNGGATVPWYFVQENLIRAERELRKAGDKKGADRAKEMVQDLSTYDGFAWKAQEVFEQQNAGK